MRFEKASNIRSARARKAFLPPAAIQLFPFAIAHPFADEARGFLRRGRVPRLVEGGAGASERGNHEPVPSRENLIVLMRPRPQASRLEQLPGAVQQKTPSL